MKRTCFCILFALCSLGLYGQEAEKPADVHVGIYVNDIFNISLKDHRFEADFFIWFRWQGETLKPLNSFQPVNGRILSKDAVVEKKKDNWNYAACRVVATFKKDWDLSRFPLDNQHLSMEFEDNEFEASALRYIPDTENSKLDPSVSLPGWEIGGARSSVSNHEYNSNYGDTLEGGDNTSVFSKYTFTVDAVRKSYGNFIKLCWGLLMATLIAFLALFIKPTDLDPRFGLGVGALFTAMANAYVISSTLPDNAGVTTADKFYILAMAFIFLTLCESVVSLWLFTSDKVEASRRLDKWSLWGGMILYALLNGWLLIP